jgi:hypothetical protein
MAIKQFFMSSLVIILNIIVTSFILYYGISILNFYILLLIFVVIIDIYITRNNKTLTLRNIFEFFKKYFCEIHDFMASCSLYDKFTTFLIKDVTIKMIQKQTFILPEVVILISYILNVLIFLELTVTHKFRYSILFIILEIFLLLFVYYCILTTILIGLNTTQTKYLRPLNIPFNQAADFFSLKISTDEFYKRYPNDTDIFWQYYLWFRYYAIRTGYINFLKENYFIYLHKIVVIFTLFLILGFCLNIIEICYVNNYMPYIIITTLISFYFLPFLLEEEEEFKRERYFRKFYYDLLIKEQQWLEDTWEKRPWTKNEKYVKPTKYEE